MKIIAISGKMGSGKTTLAEGLKQHFALKEKPVKLVKFADPLYEAVSTLQRSLGILPIKDRELLQYVGSHYRNMYGPYFWTTLFEQTVNVSSTNNIVIIDDLRYEQEYEVLREYGAFIIRLDCSIEERANRVSEVNFKGVNHPSETALDDTADFKWDLQLNTGFIEPQALLNVVLTHLMVKYE